MHLYVLSIWLTIIMDKSVFVFVGEIRGIFDDNSPYVDSFCKGL